jgi:DNA polymerase I-like protein with 3'-5' exonuclease and polymerase domains
VATDCDVPLQVGEEMQAEFFSLFPGIKEWQLDVQSFYKRNGFVTGLSGFKRHAPVPWNEMINAPIQADEALIVLEAHAALSQKDYTRYQPMFEIHDDLTFLFPLKKLEEYSDVVISEMTKPRFDWINVPLVVEMKVGKNWCDLKEVGDFENRGLRGDYKQIKTKGDMYELATSLGC